jgi:nucleotide-binding universal stress UspA family protein
LQNFEIKKGGAMIPKIEKILYATDLSPNSAYAFRYVSNSAKKHNARIVILHVFEGLSQTAQMLVNTYLDEMYQERVFKEKIEYTMERIRKRLKMFCEKEFKDDTKCADMVESIEISEGFPADEILRKADEFNCDMIAMGTHGKGTIKHAFLGSTARRVLRRVRKPVFIIPLPKGEIDITFHDLPYNQ